MPGSSVDAPHLLKKARRGDSAALGELLDRHWAQLSRIARSRCRRSDRDGEEIFQEALLCVCGSITDLRSEEVEGFLGWFGRIVERLILKRVRADRERKRPQRSCAFPWALLSPLSNDPRDPLPGHSGREGLPQIVRVESGIARAPGPTSSGKLAVLLRDGLGVRTETVALVLGRSPAAARMLRRRALRIR
ncbi:MAG TPA: hypothetical protein ENJ09_05725 [Planctomycetes bacterium]|nr:hypothetical protein [Planctomycetota bacterium]